MSPSSGSGKLKPGAKPFTRGVIYRLRGWRWFVFWPLAWTVRLYLGSLRMRMDPESRALLNRTPGPRVFAMWHNRSLLAPEVARRYLDAERIAVLISPSRMAAWEVAFYEFYQLRVIRGSSSRRGIQSVREMIRACRDGLDVAVSPDGPSGPLYDVKRGMVSVARQAGVPILFLGADCRTARRTRTWDRHLVPLPFSRVEVRARVCEPPERASDDPAACQRLQKEFLEVTWDPFTVNLTNPES